MIRVAKKSMPAAVGEDRILATEKKNAKKDSKKELAIKKHLQGLPFIEKLQTKRARSGEGNGTVKKVEIDVEKRREEVLARGKKFKYPLQYTKHKVVVNTIIVGLVSLLLLATAGWVALYRFQSLDNIMYRISTVVPVTVAKIDGEAVRFSDYLRTVRSSLKALGQQAGLEGDDNGDDLAVIREQYKRMALTQAEDLTYALKLGRELEITVSDEEVEKVFNEHRRVGGTERSEESFLKVLEANFGLSKIEYKRMLYLALMRAKVEQKIDTEANELAKTIERRLKENGGDFEAVQTELGERVQLEDTGGLIDNKNVDGGRSGKAYSLEVGQISEQFASSNGDGYYFVKTLEKDAEARKVHYVSLYIKFTEFEKRLNKVREEGLVKEYIVIK